MIFEHVQNDVNPQILRMFVGTFSLDLAQIISGNSTLATVERATKVEIQQKYCLGTVNYTTDR